jgi:hypothetical protein
MSHAEEVVDVAHPLGVAGRQVVVHRDQVRAAAGERVEVERKGGDQGLALAGLHLGDAALVQHHPAEELDVEVAHVQRAAAGLAHHGEGLQQQVVEGRPLGQALAELRGHPPELRVAHRLELWLELVDLRHGGLHLLQLPGVFGADHLLENPLDHGSPAAGRPGGPPQSSHVDTIS